MAVYDLWSVFFFLKLPNFKCPIMHMLLFHQRKKKVKCLTQNKSSFIKSFRGEKHGDISGARIFFPKMNFGEKYSQQYTML